MEQDNSQKHEIENINTFVDKDGNLCIMVKTTRTSTSKVEF